MDNASLLDQLMGKHRNLSLEEQESKRLKWSDSQVCPWFLHGFCPNELFTNTKSDLGPCERDHDLKLREEFNAEPERVRHRHARRFLSFLQKLANDADQRIEAGNQRLALTLKPDLNNPMVRELGEKITKLNENIKTLETQMAELAEQGKIEESKNMIGLVDGMKAEIKDLEKKQLSSGGLDPQQATKPMEMCPICAAFLIINDAESRVTAHLTGKQHLGYKQIREAIAEIEEELKNSVREESPPRPSRDRERERDRYRDSRDRDRTSSRRDRSRDRGDRYSDYDRRDRSRERRRRSRSRDRRDRDRRDRNRSRSRDR